jgi:hypothetical protein
VETLALVMIARDEARCIERALRSAAPHVDELCVLDTGSTDGTPALAEVCGARVAQARWTDDFAAARNAALALTDCDWRLVLDADEWIAGGADSLAEWRRAAGPRLGLVRVDSVLGDSRSASWLPRLLPRGVGYAGRVHEQPAADGLPRRRLALQLGHDGYLPAQMARKLGRNRRLLQRALREQPDDAYLHYQLGKDFEVHGELDSAEPCYARAAAAVAAQAAWRHDLVLRRLFTLKRLGRHEEAFALAQAERVHWGHSPDFFFALGDLMLDWACARPSLAAELLPVAESSWTEALRIGENPALPDTVHGRGSWLAAHNLAVLHEGLGRSARARHWREQAESLRGARPVAER